MQGPALPLPSKPLIYLPVGIVFKTSAAVVNLQLLGILPSIFTHVCVMWYAGLEGRPDRMESGFVPTSLYSATVKLYLSNCNGDNRCP